jgi:hypothetical protein
MKNESKVENLPLTEILSQKKKKELHFEALPNHFLLLFLES